MTAVQQTFFIDQDDGFEAFREYYIEQNIDRAIEMEQEEFDDLVQCNEADGCGWSEDLMLQWATSTVDQELTDEA